MITVNFKKIPIKPGYKILDIGCGSGRHTGEACRLPYAFVIGADLGFGSIKQTVKCLQYHDQLKEHGGGTWGVCSSDILNLPFKDNFFDVVICSEVMEHIKGDNLAAKEIARVLKPKKFLIVSVPRFLPERFFWAFSQSYKNTPGGHIRIYTKKGLTAVFENQDFKIQSHHFAHSLHTPYWFLKCLIGDKSLVKLYHRFLVWDIMKKPRITRFFDQLLNPVIGKSTVFYFKKK